MSKRRHLLFGAAPKALPSVSLSRLLARASFGALATHFSVMAAASLVACVTPAAAQDYTNSNLDGEVTDSSGAAVSGVTVSVRSIDQGFVRTFTTDAKGAFLAPLLPAGSYEITLTKDGFQTQQSTVRVTNAQSSYAFQLTPASDTLEEMVVTAARPKISFNNTTTGITVDVEDTFARLPIDRSILSVTLLAPNVTVGGSSGNAAFGNQPSIGGSSVAENAFYVNGLNITNFNNYVGGGLVPFEFYKSVEVKTGGYPAEFGRATGGIVNAVTKSGTNDFAATISGNFTPDFLRSQAANTYVDQNSLDQISARNLNVELSGPIIKDHLFFYGLAQYRRNRATNASNTGGVYDDDVSNDPFYAFKIDANITSKQRLEFTFFNTSRTTDRTSFSYDPETQNIDFASGPISTTTFQEGGINWVARYTGNLTSWLTLSGAYGRANDTDTTLTSNSEDPLVIDARSGTGIIVSDQTVGNQDFPLDTQREFYRADVDVSFKLLGKHHWRAGFDREILTLDRVTRRNGGADFRYILAGADNEQGVAEGREYIRRRVFQSGGSFQGANTAIYLQDSWDVTDRLNLSLGGRLDRFTAANADGVNFVEFKNEFAPRLGISWDVSGQGKDKLFASYGKYFLPVAANTSFRQGAGELFFSEYYFFNGSPSPGSGLPSGGLGAQILNFPNASACPQGALNPGARGCSVTGDGTANVPVSTISQNLQSTYENEWILGYERRLTDLLKVGINFTYRRIGRTAEDVAIDAAVLAYCNDNNISGCDELWTGFDQYVIVNPGVDSVVTLYTPLPGETDLRTITLSAADLGYPIPRRKYEAMTLYFDRTFDNKWGLQGSYTLSASRGNYEGFVKSDVGQDDAGITQDFDQPGLTDNSYGFLPNHRLHQFKLFGSYAVTKDLLMGGNLSVFAPKRYGCLGVHPTDVFAAAYGAGSFFCQGVATPRGSVFKSDWIARFDVSGRYAIPEHTVPGNLVLRLDVFNIFNIRGVSERSEFGDLPDGAPDPNFQRALTAQPPRSVRLGFEWAF